MTVAELGGARSALDRGDWPAALALLHGDDSPEASEMAAQARYANGEFEAAVATWESLHERQLAAGDRITAAWAAANVAILLLVDTGLMAPVRAWVARAERLLDDAVPVPPHAMLAMVRTYERFFCGDPEGARQQAARAIELGRQLNVPPAVILGQVATARLLISDGAVEEGLAALDDVALSLMSGAVDPMTTGMMYCELVCAAQSLLAYDRAREWTDVMERWAHGNAFGGIHGRCRVHRAELLRISGPGPAAENEAIAACDELRPWMRREFGWPLVELGNIRLRMGDLDGAEEAFLQAHRSAWAPVPGIALLRLEQGDLTAAAELIADAVDNRQHCHGKSVRRSANCSWFPCWTHSPRSPKHATTPTRPPPPRHTSEASPTDTRAPASAPPPRWLPPARSCWRESIWRPSTRRTPP